MKADALQWMVRLQGFTVLDQSVVASDVTSSSPGLIIYLRRRTLGNRETVYGHNRGVNTSRKIEEDNQLVQMIGLKLQGCMDHGLPFCFWHPMDSWLWSFPEFKALENRVPLHYTWCKLKDGKLEVDCWVLQNFGLESMPNWFDINDQQNLLFPSTVAVGLSGVFENLRKDCLPAGEDGQKIWVLNCLRHSTRGLSKRGFAEEASEVVGKMLRSAVAGKEIEHLRNMLTFIDFKGTDVRLETGSLPEGSRQPVPYPAPIWDRKVLQSYPWRQSQHINVFELIAFLNYLQLHVHDATNHSKRLIHILDSRVSSSVVAKGRSSSKMLNRILRRLTGLLLGADSYVYPLWTISSWNFADIPSRGHRPIFRDAA